jgi:hypothetical protein
MRAALASVSDDMPLKLRHTVESITPYIYRQVNYFHDIIADNRSLSGFFRVVDVLVDLSFSWYAG